jgi:hypothetical protein
MVTILNSSLIDFDDPYLLGVILIIHLLASVYSFGDIRVSFVLKSLKAMFVGGQITLLYREYPFPDH